jgi:hypothetical protein
MNFLKFNEFWEILILKFDELWEALMNFGKFGFKI